jgi:hypothetical protein
MSVLGLVLDLVFSIFVAALRTVVLREGPALALPAGPFMPLGLR